MYLCETIRKATGICLFITLLSVFIVSIVGFRDIHQKEVPCSFEARILEILKDNRALVVEKIPVTEGTEKQIVIVTDENTIIRDREKTIDLENLQVGMTIAIEGFEWFRGKHGQQVTIVLAQNIHMVFH